MYTCRFCGCEAEKDLPYCPRCGAWKAFQKKEGATEDGPVPLLDIPLEGYRGLRIEPLGDFLELPPGAVVLLGGEPGVGKSTLLLQLAASLARRFPVLYASGEEGPTQVRERAERLGIGERRLYFLEERSLPRILRAAQTISARALFLDSLQTTVASLRYSATSPQQLRLTTRKLIAYAKEKGALTFLAAQANKSSKVYGPKVVEHLVDVVCLLEYGKDGERNLRLIKNRYGPAGKILTLRMHRGGLACGGCTR